MKGGADIRGKSRALKLAERSMIILLLRRPATRDALRRTGAPPGGVPPVERYDPGSKRGGRG